MRYLIEYPSYTSGTLLGRDDGHACTDLKVCEDELEALEFFRRRADVAQSHCREEPKIYPLPDPITPDNLRDKIRGLL